MAVVLLLLSLFSFIYVVQGQQSPPNLIVILTDDVGYGDLGIYGSPSIRTPRLDQMAREGIKFDYFYTGQPICTPSRGAVITGRQPVRIGLYQNVQAVSSSSNNSGNVTTTCVDVPNGMSSVLWWNGLGGIPNATYTLPQLLKPHGYHSAAVGKWHIGIGRSLEFLPMQKGFDEFFGTPMWHYSNQGNETQQPDMPLLEGNKMIGRIYRDIDVTTLTEQYLNRSLKIIDENKNKPFFLYFCPDGTHAPVVAGKRFQGTSARGTFGDAMQEIDYGVGRIMDKLRELNMAENTFVVFSSDNGPALYTYLASNMFGKLEGGSAGLLRGGKGTTWEGGIRVPGIAWWPNRISPNQISLEVASLLDVVPTFLALAKIPVPSGYILDGKDLSPVLFGTGPSPHEYLFHWRGDTLYACIYGRYKAHFWTQGDHLFNYPTTQEYDPPLLFNVHTDPSEQFPLDATNDPNYTNVLALITAAAKTERANMLPGTAQFNLCDPAAGMWRPDLPVPPSHVTCCGPAGVNGTGCC